ncbi:MAG: ATP-dependent helicase HrpB [Shewanella sp.]|uniref:ATP-dependent helicase HrpB n=1 Tax=unclassified Shewanella TaxID=196818 RepID=UPI0021D9F0F2|nr:MULTISPECIES: ATP-dependent helicase HrpB [unclassified Shewanella]MCU8035293.1 ATP-dependent helicase HrpB [Shewanella sp. SM71]MCU8097171.1 ATP-dependent helicase HrpB [Shewanella sp. SM102]
MLAADVFFLNSLPIHSLLAPLRAAFSRHAQVVLEAPTGAGKSTALPLAMLDWPEISGRILMLEPRRVAARSVAHYIASCRQQKVGQEVGYRVRGEAKISANTRLEIVTEGILTRMIQQDPELTGIGMIIFDEIHERHLTTDLGLALALEVQASLRDDLKILAMSATLSGLALAELMPEAVTLHSEGRSFPVDIEYRPVPTQQHWIDHLGRCVLELVSASSSASVDKTAANNAVLVFLPGKGEILRLQQFLRERLADDAFLICPLYGELSGAEQDSAIAVTTDGRRKIVLATNVAESSLTIEGIGFVIDSGYKRQASFNPKTGVTRLGLKRISQASATQRSGRAGRLSAGVCVRLWSQEEHGRMLMADEPEISQADLVAMAHDCAYWGAKSFSDLMLLTPPPSVHEALAWKLLQDLGMVDAQNKLTPHGKAAYELGCHPRLAHMLLGAKSLGANNGGVNNANEQATQLGSLACLLSGVLEARGLPKKGADIMNYLHFACHGQAGQQAKQWQKKLGLAADLSKIATHAHHSDVGLLLALAYPDRIAKARGVEGYQLANGTGVVLAADDALAQTPWMVVADFQETEGRNAGRIYLASQLQPSLFDGELKGLLDIHEICGWDEAKGRVIAQRQYKVGQILVKTETIAKPERKQIVAALLGYIRQQGLQILNWNANLEQFQYRLKLATEFDVGSDWPKVDDEALLASLETWLAPYLENVNNLPQLVKLDCFGFVANCLSWQQKQRLDELLPTSWPLVTGTSAPIAYDESGRALLRVRLQETFGMAQSPMLAQGKLKVTMELLSPAQRPLALTADLASFWQGPYVEVKKEMRGRYPKHLWPDDPVNTLPTKFTKKKTLGLAQP